MKPGVSHNKPNMQQHGFYCSCGAMASFVKGHNKEIESLSISYEFKED